MYHYRPSFLDTMNAAVDALSNYQDFDRRLINAGRILQVLPECALPEDFGTAALTLARAFTHYPLSDVDSFEDRATAVIRTLPAERKERLPGLVLNLYRHIHGRSDSTKQAPQPTPATLSVAEKWEYLQWNLPYSTGAAEKDAFVHFAKAELPNVPADVLFNWIGRSSAGLFPLAVGLNLDELEFSLEAVSYTHLTLPTKA